MTMTMDGVNIDGVTAPRSDRSGNAEIAASDVFKGKRDPAGSSSSSSSAAAANTSETGDATPSRSGFFSRMGSLGLGDVYDRAQKRAVQLKEQAASEVERLRQQRDQAQQLQQQLAENATPPATATPDIGSPSSSSNGPFPEKEEEAVETKTAEVAAHGAAKCLETAGDARGPFGDRQGDKTKTTIKSISSPLRDAFNVVRTTTNDAAKEIVFPIGSEGAPKDEEIYPSIESSTRSNVCSSCAHDSGDSNASKACAAGTMNVSLKVEEKSEKDFGKIFAGVDESDEDDSPPVPDSASSSVTLTPTRFSAATSAVASAMGLRYRKLKETASLDSSQIPPPLQQQEQQRAASPVVVGGIERVGGLRHFQLDNILDDLPPSMPSAGKKADLLSQPPPGRDKLTMQSGGQWTMASNRGPNAIFTSAASSVTAGSDAASSAASETASDDGVAKSQTPATAGKPLGGARGGRASYYEQAVRSVLHPGQRALFFGKGTMGVVLKPTYLASWRGKDGGGLLSPSAIAAKGGKKGGVFIDSLVPGGHAEKSGVVFVGDHIIKIGAVNVQNMTLEEVVNVILETKRPNIMVLTSEHEVKVANTVEHEALAGGGVLKRGFLSSLDLVFGFSNMLMAEGVAELGPLEKEWDDTHEKKGNSLGPAASLNSLVDNDDGINHDAVKDDDSSGEEEVFFGSPGKGNDIPASVNEEKDSKRAGQIVPQSLLPDLGPKPDADPEQAASKVILAQRTQRPISCDIETLIEYASHRTNKHSKDTEKQNSRSSSMKRAALLNADFRNALCLSMSECVSDPRRYSFLEYFFKNYQSKAEQVNDDGVNSSKNQTLLLELYLELCKFNNAVMVCSVSYREKLLCLARKISTLFLSEDITDDKTNDQYLPENVVHLALGGVKKIQSVRIALRDEDEFFDDDDGGNGFDSIRLSLEAFLSTQESYLSFLISDDCARMRAYLRGSSPFLCVKPDMFLKTSGEGSRSHNFLCCAVLHLICMKDESDEKNDHSDANFIKNDALLSNVGKRNMGASSLLCCAIFIMRSLKNSIERAVEGLIEDDITSATNSRQFYSALVEDVEFFWQAFISPAGGSLSSMVLFDDTQDALDLTRRVLASSVDVVLAEKNTLDVIHVMAGKLSDGVVLNSVLRLADALLCEYTLRIFPNFCRHIFYEWACNEATEHRCEGGGNCDLYEEYIIPFEYNGLTKGWMNRFLRQMELPGGVSLHRPGPTTLFEKDSFGTLPTSPKAPGYFHNGDVALVFGSGNETLVRDENLRRFCCVSLHPQMEYPSENVLLPQDIPSTFESYAIVPPFHERPFQGMLQDKKNDRISIDGWEVSLTNFVIPSQAHVSSGAEKWMYCVSLVFRKNSSARQKICDRDVDKQSIRELEYDEPGLKATFSEFSSPIFTSESEGCRKMKVTKKLKEFNRKLLQEHKWDHGVVIGLALISSRNVTHAMRDSLSLLYSDICAMDSSSDEPEGSRYLCQPLVDILGVMSSHEVESASLDCLLRPYITHINRSWLHRPLSEQSVTFLEAAGAHLLQALPPVPLALAFITLLLEQKVVFSSSRRGMLMSASFAVMQLLLPLKWAHLHAPLVPVAMMNELIHYPAPFVLGIPTDEKESAAILSTLPCDVTLVDLDVGRVILASKFTNEASGSVEGASDEALAGALRSQVLFLAESLGGSFGSVLYQNSWCSDSPLQVLSNDSITPACKPKGNFSDIVDICGKFISELLSGLHSCCTWIEEKHCNDASPMNEPAIIFDEDRFYHMKNLSAEGRYLPLIQGLSTERVVGFLSLDYSDLVFETFLRTQGLSTYISSQNKKSMLFW